MNISNKENYNFGYSNTTLFLTECGWAHYNEILPNTKIGTVNPLTYELEFQYPICKIHNKAFQNYIYDFENNDSHFQIAENHDVYYSYIKNINTYGHTYDLERSLWIKNPVNEFIAHKYHNHILNFPINANEDFPIDDELLELIGFFVSDGTIIFYKNKKVKHLRVTQSKYNPLFYEKMDKIKKKYCGNEYIYKEHIWHFNSEIGNLIYNLCGHGSANKHLPYFIYNLSIRQANVLLTALLLGDGTNKIEKENRSIYYTISKNLANDMVSLGYLANKKSNIIGMYNYQDKFGKNPSFQIATKENENIPSYMHSKKHQKKIDYYDECVSFIVPNGLLLTMYNGKPAIQPN